MNTTGVKTVIFTFAGTWLLEKDTILSYGGVLQHSHLSDVQGL